MIVGPSGTAAPSWVRYSTGSSSLVLPLPLTDWIEIPSAQVFTSPRSPTSASGWPTRTVSPSPTRGFWTWEYQVVTSSALRTLISHGPAVALSWVTVTVPAVAATTGVPQAASNRVSSLQRRGPVSPLGWLLGGRRLRAPSPRTTCPAATAAR